MIQLVNSGIFEQPQPSADPWSPSTDITPVAWLDASDTSSYTLSFNNLASVTDKAGNHSITVDGTPQRISAGLNGLNTWTFDGNESLISSNFPAQVSNGNHWAIGVFKFSTVDNTKDSVWSYETNQSPKRDYAISSGASNNTWPGELDLDGLSSNRISSTIGNKELWNLQSLVQNQWAIVACWFNKTGNQIGVRIGGANAFTPVNDYDNSVSTNQQLRIMRNRAGVKTAGTMAEFFAVADLPGTGGTDISDLEKAEGYLAHKWGLTFSLSASHPYKTSAP